MKILKNKKILQYFFVIFLTSFLLGVIFSFQIGKNIVDDLLKSKTYVVTGESTYEENDLDLTRVLEAYFYLKREYYDSDVIKKNDLVESAIKWMVDWLWDKHYEYMTKKETKNFHEALSWDFEWIGAVVEKVELWVMIERILKGSPAKNFGLLKGDILIEANGIELEDLDLYEAVDNIKGPAGTKVVLKYLRAWEIDPLETEVIRGKIKIPSVDSKILEDTDIWYIAVNMFWWDTEVEFKKALEDFKEKEGIIIDLRDNGWGYLQSAVVILSNFIKNGKNIVFTKYKNIFDNNVYKSVNNGDTYEWKIVVLINGNSASASEITAGALRDYNKAILVWEKSYWKWSVQQPFDLSSGWTLKLTIARWFTPKNKNIDKEWIEPDIEIRFLKEDYENDYDRQLEEAKKVLNNFIKYGSLKLSVDEYNNSTEK